MSKRAEEAALEAYPEKTLYFRDYNQLAKRQIYQQGYNQAEKDLALTWEDIKMIDVVMHNVATEHTYGVIRLSTFKEFYEEVLRRFNELKRNRNENH